MLAARMHGYKQPLVLEDIKVPAIMPGASVGKGRRGRHVPLGCTAHRWLLCRGAQVYFPFNSRARDRRPGYSDWRQECPSLRSSRLAIKLWSLPDGEMESAGNAASAMNSFASTAPGPDSASWWLCRVHACSLQAAYPSGTQDQVGRSRTSH